MRKGIALMTLAGLAAASLVLAVDPPREVKALRLEQKGPGQRVDVLYRYEKDKDPVAPTTQAAIRGKEAAEAWKAFEKSEKPVALLGRSPFGGGETPTTYWPKGVKIELLSNLVEPLTKAGLKVDLAEPPPTTAPADADAPERKPWPKVGFGEDYEFVLLVGLHHEPIPYEGVRRTEDGKPTYFRSHRMSAWAILFHAPTATAFWGATAVVMVGHQGVEDPVALAAETVLSYLEFGDIGKDNIPEYVERLAETRELPAVDIAAMLVQTQRADAVEAALKAARSDSALRTTAWVLRYFNAGGTVQDYRLGLEDVQRQGLTLAAQRVPMRLLLLEQLRGMRALQPCVMAALVPQTEDLDLFKIGRQYAGRLEPLGSDEEIVLIAELANDDPQKVFGERQENLVAAIRSLGRCQRNLDEAVAVARYYAERPQPPVRPGRPAPRDPLRQAGQAALQDLSQTRQEQQKKAAEMLRTRTEP